MDKQLIIRDQYSRILSSYIFQLNFKLSSEQPEWYGELVSHMLLIDVPEAECIVFEHGSFGYEQENRSVEEKIENAMANFDFTDTGYCLDTTLGRIMYFYHDA